MSVPMVEIKAGLVVSVMRTKDGGIASEVMALLSYLFGLFYDELRARGEDSVGHSSTDAYDSRGARSSCSI